MNPIERMTALAAMHRQKADALDVAIQLLKDDLQQSQTARSRTIIAQATAITSERLNGHKAQLQLGDGKKKKSKAGVWKASPSAVKDRLKTAKFLALFSTTEPRLPKHPKMKRVSRLLAFGYLKREGTQYLRTDKPFNPYGASGRPEGTTPRVTVRQRKGQPTIAQQVTARRKITSEYLAKYSPTETRKVPSPTGNLIGVLVRRGYLKPSGEGYLRTSKEFSLTLS